MGHGEGERGRLGELAGRGWDVVVIGAGPAGSVAAMSLSGAGRSVLLVDRAVFPRSKVCGSCLNGAALAELETLGLGEQVEAASAGATRVMRLAAMGRSCSIRMHRSVAISRARLDAMLVARAREAGAVFIDGVSASMEVENGDGCIVQLRDGGERCVVRCEVVVDAAGLKGAPCCGEAAGEGGAAWRIADDSYMGVGAIVSGVAAAGWPVEAGELVMAVGRRGYVGLVRLEDGGVDVAAAVSPGFVREAGGPGEAIGALLEEAGVDGRDGLDESQLVSLGWQGTPLLTRRRRRLSGRASIAIGDAAGYVEPFTGEGMAWAVRSAKLGAKLVGDALEAGDVSKLAMWPGEYRRRVARRGVACRALRWCLRRPVLVRAGVGAISHFEQLSRPIVRGIQSVRPALSAGAWKG